jgi:hypothetical protein
MKFSTIIAAVAFALVGSAAYAGNSVDLVQQNTNGKNKADITQSGHRNRASVEQDNVNGNNKLKVDQTGKHNKVEGGQFNVSGNNIADIKQRKHH